MSVLYFKSNEAKLKLGLSISSFEQFKQALSIVVNLKSTCSQPATPYLGRAPVCSGRVEIESNT